MATVQLPLPFHQLARASDPVTSDLAGEAIQRDGTHIEQMYLVLAALVYNPGCTSCEIAHYSGLDRYTVARRLPDLAAEGRAERVKDENGQLVKRKCRVTGRMAIVWRAR